MEEREGPDAEEKGRERVVVLDKTIERGGLVVVRFTSTFHHAANIYRLCDRLMDD